MFEFKKESLQTPPEYSKNVYLLIEGSRGGTKRIVIGFRAWTNSDGDFYKTLDTETHRGDYRPVTQSGNHLHPLYAWLPLPEFTYDGES